MIHDQALLDRLSALPTQRFDSLVFRATRIAGDPTAPSTMGGRWALPPDNGPGTAVLYTSLERDGAIAEVASFLASLTPIPGKRLVKITRLALTAERIVTLTRHDLESLGVDTAKYGERDYVQTQRIGSALAFLERDGLLAPSARWPCDNLMIFADNHGLSERLDVLDTEEVEWRAWAEEHGFL